MRSELATAFLMVASIFAPAMTLLGLFGFCGFSFFGAFELWLMLFDPWYGRDTRWRDWFLRGTPYYPLWLGGFLLMVAGFWAMNRLDKLDPPLFRDPTRERIEALEKQVQVLQAKQREQEGL
jgi:hypothetical protein